MVLQLPSFTLNYLEQLDIFKIMTSFCLSQLQENSVISLGHVAVKINKKNKKGRHCKVPNEQMLIELQ